MNRNSKNVSDWKKQNIIGRKVVEFNKSEKELYDYVDQSAEPFQKKVKRLLRKAKEEEGK